MKQKEVLVNRQNAIATSSVICLVSLLALSPVFAQFVQLSRYVIDECEPLPWSHRIYSYDFDVDSNGLIHVVYSKPMPPNYTNDVIIYAYGTATNMTKIVLDTDGKHPTITAFIVVDRERDNKVHICYNAGQELGEETFRYKYILNGKISQAFIIDSNANHSRMQLDENGWPIFVREYGKGLHFFQPVAETQWMDVPIDTGGITDARIGDFAYDKERKTYHLLYGDNACDAIYRDRKFHRLWYAVSTNDSRTWQNEMVNGSCALWEDEFWVSLALDGNSQPCVSMYKFATYNDQHNTGTSLFYAKKVNGAWTDQIIAGAIPGSDYPPDHRAGMGAILATDGDAVFTFYDDSPDYPVDFAGKYGNIVLHYTKNGIDWEPLQQVAEFSAEGYCRTKIHEDRIYLLVMGDFHDTKIYFYSYLLSDPSMLSNSLPVVGDFDGDGKAGYGIYYPPTGFWQLNMTSNGVWENNFGFDGSSPITGDFDGDGSMDFGCYYPPTGWWFIYKSDGGDFWTTQFGYSDTIPFTGDFDGDAVVDFGCYFPPEGYWYIFQSRDGFRVERFGYAGTQPVTGDFDGDEIRDFGCFYPPTGWWYIYRSMGGFQKEQFGYVGTEPITGDFDGDGICDFGCYYAPGGWWYIFKSTDGFWTNQFGYGGTLPVTADFDGDGTCDFGCFDPNSGSWFMYCSTDGFKTEQSVVY